MSWDPRSDGEQNDISQLSDSELVERLRDYGADPGPIVATTRRVYEKKLMKLMVGMSEDFENCNETEDFEAEAYSDSDDGGELDIQDQRRVFAEGKEILTKSELTMKNPKGSLLAEFGERLGERPHGSSLRRFVLTHQDAVARQRRCNSVPPRLKPDEDESATKDPWCFPTKSLRRSDYLRRSQDWLKADLDKAAAVPLASSPPQVAVLPLPHPKIAQRGSPFRQDPMQQKKLPSPSNFSPGSDEFDYGPLDTTVLQAPLIEKAASPKSITFAVKTALNEKCLELPKRPEREFDLYRSPTGISVTRRPPIRGAAHGNYASPLLSQRVTEMYARPRLTHRELPRANAAPVAKRRSVPIWVRVIIAVTLLIFILLVYGAMEENFEMPSEILGSKGDQHLDHV